jgi:hypothetical protein
MIGKGHVLNSVVAEKYEKAWLDVENKEPT